MMDWVHKELAQDIGFDWYGIELAVEQTKDTKRWRVYDMRSIADPVTGIKILDEFDTLEEAKQFVEVYHKVGA